MTDRNVEFPNRYRMVKVEGADDIYDLIPAPGTVAEEGTFVNKAALLKDATAALFGFTDDQLKTVVPDDALQAIKALIDTARSEAAAKGNTKIATGSYTGDGSTSKTFSFGFTAQILFLFAKTDFILSNYYVRSAAVFFNGSGTGIIGTTFTNANSMELLTGHTFDGSTVSNNSSSPVWNMSGATYGYIAIG